MFTNYIFPPRPQTKATQASIPMLVKRGLGAQPKLNGSCGQLFTDGKNVEFMNRHTERFSNALKIDIEELKVLHRKGGLMVLSGEYMNKSQRDAKSKVFNGKFVIWDILVLDGKRLVGTTFEERLKILDKLFGTEEFDEWLYKVSENVFRVKTFTKDVPALWTKIVKIGMYEGFVFKKFDGILEGGNRAQNNVRWQIKIRKPTKNYSS